jgi:hypothetical protein
MPAREELLNVTEALTEAQKGLIALVSEDQRRKWLSQNKVGDSAARNFRRVLSGSKPVGKYGVRLRKFLTDFKDVVIAQEQ